MLELVLKGECIRELLGNIDDFRELAKRINEINESQLEPPNNYVSINIDGNDGKGRLHLFSRYSPNSVVWKAEDDPPIIGKNYFPK